MSLREGDPAEVGGYRLERRLGAGGMGVVFLGRSVSGRRLAIKVIRPELVADEGFRVRFRREVEAARQVSGAFTAPVVDADADAEQPWLATLFVPGPSLHDHVAEQGPLAAADVRRLAAGLVEALRDIHRVGLVHRDLKPANVLLAEDGPRVIDFGIARAIAAPRLTTTGSVVGTPGFMAPEQFRTGGVGAAGDVFALGSVLVFAATGHGPFDGESDYGIGYRVVHEEPDLTGLPAELLPLVEPCLAKEPGARPTVAELLAALSDADTPRAAGEAPDAVTDAPPAVAPSDADADPRSGAADPRPAPRKPAEDSPPPVADALPATRPDAPPLRRLAADPPPAATPEPGAAPGAIPGPEDAPPARIADPRRTDAPPEPDPAAHGPRAAAPGGVFGPPPGLPHSPPAEAPSPSRGRPHRNRLIVVAAVLAVTAGIAVPLLVDKGDATGKGAGDSPAHTATSGPAATTTSASASADGVSCGGAKGRLSGSGSSILSPTMAAWMADFQAHCSGVSLTYSPNGSGAGLAGFLAGSMDFAAADGPLTTTRVQQSKERCTGGGQAVNLPLAATTVAIAYNLPGVSRLVLDTPTLARIFDGRITRWNDVALRKLNPYVQLPSLPVQAVHRQDGSAVSTAFANFLTAAAPNDWPYAPDDTSWPGRGGTGATGTAAVHQLVASTAGSIGYLDLEDASDLATVRLDTGAPDPVAAGASGTTTWLSTAKPGGSGGELALDLDPATSARGAYPIALVSYAVVCDKGNDPARLTTLRAFLSYATSMKGRQVAAAQDRAPLPEALAEKVHDTALTLG
ncbi:substrate-binding domain-containing protein [Streptomyces sp. NBC_00433]